MELRRSEINKLIESEVNKRIEMLKEDAEAGLGGCVPGGAYYTGGGGAYGPFQTLANTVGIGNPVPAGSDGIPGSGDKFDNIVTKPAKKKGVDEK